MNRFALLAAVAAVTLAACGTGGAKPSIDSGLVVHATTSNRAAAIIDAQRLLAGVHPPSGSVLQAAATAVGTQQEKVSPLTSATESALATKTWTVPGPPGAVLSRVERHLPAGSKLVSSGGGGPGFSELVIRSWAPVPGVLDTRWIEINVYASSSSSARTRLKAVAQSQWVLLRPAAEHVPSSVTRVTVKVSGHSGRIEHAVTVTSKTIVRELVALYNRLGIVQPGGVISCPMFSTPSSLTVTFRNRAAQTVARAVSDADANFSWPAITPGWSCFPIMFTEGHHTYPSLNGNVIAPLQRLLHTKLS